MKKLTSILLCTVAVLSLAVGATSAPPQYATLQDALEILRDVVNLPNDARVETHDFNGNGELDVQDALLVLRGVVGIGEKRVIGVLDGQPSLLICTNCEGNEWSKGDGRNHGDMCLSCFYSSCLGCSLMQSGEILCAFCFDCCSGLCDDEETHWGKVPKNVCTTCGISKCAFAGTVGDICEGCGMDRCCTETKFGVNNFCLTCDCCVLFERNFGCCKSCGMGCVSHPRHGIECWVGCLQVPPAPELFCSNCNSPYNGLYCTHCGWLFCEGCGIGIGIGEDALCSHCYACCRGKICDDLHSYEMCVCGIGGWQKRCRFCNKPGCCTQRISATEILNFCGDCHCCKYHGRDYGCCKYCRTGCMTEDCEGFHYDWGCNGCGILYMGGEGVFCTLQGGFGLGVCTDSCVTRVGFCGDCACCIFGGRNGCCEVCNWACRYERNEEGQWKCIRGGIDCDSKVERW